MPPILINTAEPMAKIKVVAVKDDSDKLLTVLQQAGMLHIEESHELQPIDRSKIEQEHKEVNELYTYINKILSYLPDDQTVKIDDDVEVIYTRPFSEISSEVKQVYNRTSRLQERIEAINNEYSTLTDMYRYLRALADMTNLTLNDLNYSGNYLTTNVIVIAKDSYKMLKEAYSDFVTENIVTDVENETVIHVVTPTKNADLLDAVITNHGGITLNIPHENINLTDYLSTGSGRVSSLEEEKEKLTKELNDIVGDDIKKLALLREALTAENDRLSVLEKASEAKYVTVVEGWIPQKLTDEGTADIKEAIDYAYVEIRDPEEGEEPPVEYRNPKGFKPFQIVVNMFATPKYREWDPTPIISYSFAFFFGLMVCDVLYALGLILLTKFVLAKFTDNPYSETFQRFKRLLYTCAGVALIGGLLTGQYFGDIYTLAGIDELPTYAYVAVVRNYLQDPLHFIIVALVIGFIHVNISHIIAFVKAIKERDTGNILSKIGLAMLQFGLPGILHGLLGADIPFLTPAIYSILNYVMLAGIVLIFVSSIMVNKGLGAILWLFDITGILGDVMSYARLAGVGLATYYLASTFNLMANLFGGMFSGVIGTIIGVLLAIFIIVLGHGINMVLTAITGFMHSLRLCFVEFLFKFYEGGGTEYDPFRFKKRTVIPLVNKS